LVWELVQDINYLYGLSLKGEYDLAAIAFALAGTISNHESLSFLYEVSDEVVKKLKDLLEGYKLEGECLVVSNVGVVDYSVMFEKVVRLFEGNSLE